VQKSPYKDLTVTHWAYSTIAWGSKEKLAKGYPDGTFKPSQSVSEREFLAMMIRSFKGDLPAKQGEAWFRPYYVLASQLNYPVNSDNTLRAKAINRGNVAKLITAVQGFNLSDKESVYFLMATNFSSGKGSSKNLLNQFGANESLTRAEAISFIKRLKERQVALKPNPPQVTTLNQVFKDQPTLKADDGIDYNILNQFSLEESRESLSKHTYDYVRPINFPRFVTPTHDRVFKQFRIHNEGVKTRLKIYDELKAKGLKWTPIYDKYVDFPLLEVAYINNKGDNDLDLFINNYRLPLIYKENYKTPEGELVRMFYVIKIIVEESKTGKKLLSQMDYQHIRYAPLIYRKMRLIFRLS
jgi:hypothetical protein